MADLYLSVPDESAAKTVLLKAVAEHPTAKLAHYKIGLMQANSADAAERSMATQHFRSAFSNGDNNYQAQLWYGRQLFVAGQPDEADKVFGMLSNAGAAPSVKNSVVAAVTELSGENKLFRGQVVKKEVGYAFVASRDHARDIYAYEFNSDREGWDSFDLYDEVKFELAFNFKGPVCCAVRRA